MISRFDDKTAFEFVAPTSMLLGNPGSAQDLDSVINVVFTYGPANGRPTVSDTMTAARKVRKAFIHLEFVVGRESDGPSNVVVVTAPNGKWNSWPACDIWSDFHDTATGMYPATIIMPKGEDFCFSYDGVDLFLVPGRPTADFLLGVERARANLKMLRLTMSLLKMRGPAH
jgi:hypothetical protein